LTRKELSLVFYTPGKNIYDAKRNESDGFFTQNFTCTPEVQREQRERERDKAAINPFLHIGLELRAFFSFLSSSE
jgi:hypothetical protein